jgi:hypothetical protein
MLDGAAQEISSYTHVVSICEHRLEILGLALVNVIEIIWWS